MHALKKKNPYNEELIKEYTDTIEHLFNSKSIPKAYEKTMTTCPRCGMKFTTLMR